MDLTNIKPCVECAKYWECAARWIKLSNFAVSAMAEVRGRQILVLGDDCFEEEDDANDGQHS